MYLTIPEGYLVTAANAGNDREPQWWANLQGAGSGVVHVEGCTETVTPRLVQSPEREQLFAALVAAYPAIGEYGRDTDRVFPVVVLRPS